MKIEQKIEESIDSKAKVLTKAYRVQAGVRDSVCEDDKIYTVIPENEDLTEFTVILNDRNTYKTEYVTIGDENCECSFYEKNVLHPESDNERCHHIIAGYKVRKHILTEELNVGFEDDDE